jgi:hypothetical protein
MMRLMTMMDCDSAHRNLGIHHSLHSIIEIIVQDLGFITRLNCKLRLPKLINSPISIP